jgi:hypothetical protein
LPAVGSKSKLFGRLSERKERDALQGEVGEVYDLSRLGVTK